MCVCVCLFKCTWEERDYVVKATSIVGEPNSLAGLSQPIFIVNEPIKDGSPSTMGLKQNHKFGIFRST